MVPITSWMTSAPHSPRMRVIIIVFFLGSSGCWSPHLRYVPKSSQQVIQSQMQGQQAWLRAQMIVLAGTWLQTRGKT